MSDTVAESPDETQALSLVFPPAVIERIAERVAELVATAKPDQEREGYLNVDEALDFLGWGKRGTSRLYNLTCSNAIPHYMQNDHNDRGRSRPKATTPMSAATGIATAVRNSTSPFIRLTSR